MAENYIVIDLGASNGRVIVARYSERRFDFDIVYRFENVPVLSNEGEFFWDILRIFSDIKEGIRKACHKYPDVRSVGIDTFGCDFGFIDEKGRLMGNPLHYRDEAQHQKSDELHKAVPEEELFKMCQTPCNRIMGIYKLWNLKQMDAFEYKCGARLLMIPDILNYLLTGKVANEFTNATMTLLVDQYKRQWSEEACDRLGFRKDIFTRLSEPGTILGPIKRSVCEELEIEPIQVVIPATHDTAAAVAGIPVSEADKSWGFVSLGTWALAGIENAEPICDLRMVPLEFGNEGGTFGTTMILKNLNGMWIIQQCRKRWILDQGEDISWDEIVRQAKEARVMDSVIDIDDERFGAVQNNMPKVVSDFCRETGQEIPGTLGEIAACVYKSLALEIRDSFDGIMGILEKKLDLLHLVGGGTQNHLLCQWISNAMGIPAVCGPTETTAMGNLVFQLLADKKVDTLAEAREVCADSSELYHVEPEDIKSWDAAYGHYRKIVS